MCVVTRHSINCKIFHFHSSSFILDYLICPLNCLGPVSVIPFFFSFLSCLDTIIIRECSFRCSFNYIWDVHLIFYHINRVKDTLIHTLCLPLNKISLVWERLHFQAHKDSLVPLTDAVNHNVFGSTTSDIPICNSLYYIHHSYASIRVFLGSFGFLFHRSTLIYINVAKINISSLFHLMLFNINA